MDLAAFIQALEMLYELSKRYPEQVFGEFEKRQAPLSLPELPTVVLSPELAYFYSRYHCNAILGSVGIAITPFEKLERRQEGFASFSTDLGKTLHPNPDWNKQWTVFADLNDDPVVADASGRGTPVYAAIEAVNYQLLTPSLTTFFVVLAEMMRVTASLKAQQPTTDDVEEWITFQAKVEAPTTLRALQQMLDEQYVEAINHFFYA